MFDYLKKVVKNSSYNKEPYNISFFILPTIAAITTGKIFSFIT